MSASTSGVDQSLLQTINILASSYTKIIMYHDLANYDLLEEGSASLLECLKVPKEKIGQVSRIVSHMYRTSDDADVQLNLGNRESHNELFRRIYKMAEEIDNLLDVTDGSVRDEIHWWYHYRLSRSKVRGKKPNKLRSVVHFVLTLFFIYNEHLRRTKAPIKALKCTYWLMKAGKRHERDNWTRVEIALKHYWSLKIDANRGRVKPKLILV